MVAQTSTQYALHSQIKQNDFKKQIPQSKLHQNFEVQLNHITKLDTLQAHSEKIQ